MPVPEDLERTNRLATGVDGESLHHRRDTLPAESTFSGEELERYRAAYDQLDPVSQHVLHRVEVDGLSYAELAAELTEQFAEDLGSIIVRPENVAGFVLNARNDLRALLAPVGPLEQV